MADRYGNTKVAKVLAAFNDLRSAIRSGDIEGAEKALDRYEPWADYIFDERHDVGTREEAWRCLRRD